MKFKFWIKCYNLENQGGRLWHQIENVETVGIASIVIIGTFAIASTERLKTAMQMDARIM